MSAPAPPYRVLTRRLLLRCFEPTDAEELREVAARNRDHLAPWMPWAKDDPQTVAEKVQLLRGFRARFDRDEDYVFGAFGRESGALVGATGLHRRVGPRAFETGYWVDREHVRRGLASEMAAAMTRVAFDLLRVERVELHVDVRNAPSLGVPRKLGFVADGVLRRRSPTTLPEPGDMAVFTMFADEYPGTACAEAPLEAFDVLGARLL